MGTTTNQQDQSNQTSQGNTIVEFPDFNTVAKTPTTHPLGPMPVVKTPTPTPTPTPTSQPTSSSIQKELEPMPSLIAKPDIIHETEHVVELVPEVKAAGVEAVSTIPQLTLEEKKIGVELAKEAALEEKKLEPDLKAPISKMEAEKITKGQLLFKDTSNPMLWLAMLLLRQIQILTRQKQSKEKKI